MKMIEIAEMTALIRDRTLSKCKDDWKLLIDFFLWKTEKKEYMVLKIRIKMIYYRENPKRKEMYHVHGILTGTCSKAFASDFFITFPSRGTWSIFPL